MAATQEWSAKNGMVFTIFLIHIKGEPELTDPFNLLINVKLRMQCNEIETFFFFKNIFMAILYPSYYIILQY